MAEPRFSVTAPGAPRPALPALPRRGFLVAMAAMAAVFGFPRASRAAMNPAAIDGRPVAAMGRLFEPTIWYWIDASGQVNVNIINLSWASMSAPPSPASSPTSSTRPGRTPTSLMSTVTGNGA